MNTDETLDRVAGKVGEAMALVKLRSALSEEDQLITNVVIDVDGIQTELDAVVINSKGVFIIEIKNFNGKLYGSEDSHTWERTKKSEAGYSFTETIRNPIVQLKREIYMLSMFLKEHNINVFVKGFVYFVQWNSPIESKYVINSPKYIEKAIHSKNKTALDLDTINSIRELLSN